MARARTLFIHIGPPENRATTMPNEDLSTKDTLRDHVIAWLAANGIDAKVIPAIPHMTLVGDRLTTDRRVLNAAGRVQTDPSPDEDGNFRIATETVTYTITEAPPPDVAAWLLPRCTECGR